MKGELNSLIDDVKQGMLTPPEHMQQILTSQHHHRYQRVNLKYKV